MNDFAEILRRANSLGLTAAYARGVWTPDEVVQQCLALAEKSESVFICLNTERALAQARASSARWLAGQPRGPLDGVPVTWKDLFDIEGLPTTAGSALLEYAKPASRSAAVVCRAEAAGMISLGKTNLSEFAYSGLGLNPRFGTPVNSRLGEARRAPGGSSSGAAVALALGIGPLAMGTDTAGSVRIPAAFNGLVGYRASRQRYPMDGVFGLAPSLDTLGPLAKSVADCLAMDDVLCGGYGRNTTEATDLSQEVFVLDPALLESAAASRAVCKNLLICLQRLRDAGARIEQRVLGSWHEVYALIERYGWLGAYEAFALHRERLDDHAQAQQMDKRVRNRLETARHFQRANYQQLLAVRTRLQSSLARELAGATLVLPTVAHSAPLLAPLECDDTLFAESNLATLRWTMYASFLDAPAVALPSGLELVRAPDGGRVEHLPTSMQLIRPNGDDDELLRVALAVERALVSSSLPTTGGV